MAVLNGGIGGSVYQSGRTLTALRRDELSNRNKNTACTLNAPPCVVAGPLASSGLNAMYT